jgi:hypothetical protein
VVHHADYLKARDDHALCGVALTQSSAVAQADAEGAVCVDCEAQLIVYHLEWWRETALAATAELEKLRAEHGVPGTDDSEASVITPETHRVDESDQTEPATFLDRARRDLVELCRQFEGAVPFYRLKNAMQDFNDGLDDPGRALLAEEVHPHGSLIRWATTEVEALGLTVTNNRVRENNEMQWEDWLQESQPAPKVTKRRFGRR